MFFKNAFKNCLKRLSIKEEIRKRLEALKEIKALLLMAFNYLLNFRRRQAHLALL